ncbi:hypothetical protein ACH5RR_002390 [Cinchona calisaya]|uniref:Uncharacterized protein n=1 Tax=Cinchona calisaya TaxID=153742 RepID=A0ABD3B664_9GENT
MQGQMPGNVNFGLVAPPRISGVQGLAPGDANTGWATLSGNVGSAVEVPAPGNGWALPTGNQGAPLQGTPSVNTNQGWGAVPGNQGTWGSEQYRRRGNFSSLMDIGSQAGDSRYHRPWSRQSSFGSRA